MKKTEEYKENDLLSLVYKIVTVNGEMIKGNGEDSYSHIVNERYGFFGVFDGCGGIGSRKYEEFDNKTGAYIASRVVSDMSYEWFMDFCNRGEPLSEHLICGLLEDMREFLIENLVIVDACVKTTAIKGSLTKKFPTTSALALCEYQQGFLEVCFVWAGDSRGYVLTKDGLVQVTIDDVSGNMDAMSNLSDDGRLTNVISANGDFKLNHKIITISQPTILITATDGCFGYFSTPMEFEYMLVETLTMSYNLENWQGRLDQYIRQYTGDDYTMCITICGYKKFSALKKAYISRKQQLYTDYISKLNTANLDKKNKLWKQYKKAYYQGAE